MRLLLLHGFTATGRSWAPVRGLLDAQRYSEVLAPDLSAPSIAAQVAELGAHLPAAVCGYSMGGRIALHLALAAPEQVERLVLVSTTAGIEDPQERAERAAADDKLAADIERDGLETFADWWATQPLFADQPEAVRAAAHADRVRHTASELATILRGLGTGVMEPVWDRLHELTMPATVVVGERDEKFRALGERLAATLPNAELVIAPGAGHAVHLETPEAVASAL